MIVNDVSAEFQEFFEGHPELDCFAHLLTGASEAAEKLCPPQRRNHR
jgi:hypothetical protein